jgi:hypothetical protein
MTGDRALCIGRHFVEAPGQQNDRAPDSERHGLLHIV